MIMATTTQEHIDGLITTIWHAQEDRSVSNLMVARVLDWLNSRAKTISDELAQGITEHAEDMEAIQSLLSQEKALREQSDVALRNAIQGVVSSLSGLSIKVVSEGEYEKLVEAGTTDDATLYLIPED